MTLNPSSTGVVVADAIRLVRIDGDRGFSYSYDRNGQQTSVTNNDGTARATSYNTQYDALGRPLVIEEKNPTTTLRQTTYTYDLNPNPASVVSGRTLQTGATDDGGNLAVTSSTSYGWDVRNLLVKVTSGTNAGTTADPNGLRQWDYTWNSRGLLASVTKPGPSAGTAPRNLITYKYFDNGLLREQRENRPAFGTNPANASVDVAVHQLTYNDDGDPKRDMAQFREPDSATVWRSQTSRYDYTPTRQLASVIKTGSKKGGDETYGYDVAGNVVTARLGRVTTTSGYVGNRLTTSTPRTDGVNGGPPVTGPASTYHYDDFGRLDNVTTGGQVTATYGYDGFDRIVSQTQGAGASLTTTSTSYDPFDRPVLRTVGQGSKTSKTRFNYLGLSRQVAAEEQTDATHPWQVTKAYTYGPGGGQDRDRLYAPAMTFRDIRSRDVPEPLRELPDRTAQDVGRFPVSVSQAEYCCSRAFMISQTWEAGIRTRVTTSAATTDRW